jgi:sodium/potassium-transporting ATPase subunit alpha
VQWLKEMTGLFNYVMWIGSALCFLAYGLQEVKEDKSNLYLAIVLILVILISGSLNFN